MTAAALSRMRTVNLPDRTGRVAASIVVGLIAMPCGAAEVLETGDPYSDRVPVYTVIPEYPKVARRDRIEGEVQVCFEITRKGRTRRIAVRRSTHRLFEKPARRAVKESRYAPLPDDAALPTIKACRTFRFTLEPSGTQLNGPSH